MKLINLIAFLFITFLLSAQQPQFTSVDFFSVASNATYVRDTHFDKDGNLYVVGDNYKGILDLGSVALDSEDSWQIFMIKFNAQRQIVWTKTYPTTYYTGAYSITTDAAGNVYAAGNFSDSMRIDGQLYVAPNHPGHQYRFEKHSMIIKMDTSGQEQWVLTGRDSISSNISSLEVDDQGMIFFTGYFTNKFEMAGTTVHSNGKNDILLGKVDPDGNLLWLERFGGGYTGDCGLDNNDNGEKLVLDEEGNVYFTGHFVYSVNFDGQNTLYADDNADAYVAKFDTDGNYVWARTFGGRAWDYGKAIAIDQEGNVLVAGRFQIDFKIENEFYETGFQPGTNNQYATHDFFVVKYDKDGNFIWSFRDGLDTDVHDELNDMIVDWENNIYITGTYADTSRIGGVDLNIGLHHHSKIFLVKYTSNGTPVYTKSAGGLMNEKQVIDISPDGEVILAGTSRDQDALDAPLEFDAIMPSLSDRYYMFIATLHDPDNSPRPTSIENVNKENYNLSLYPNPTANQLQINTNVPLHKIQILDVMGRSMLTSNLDDQTKDHTIDVSHLPNGLYFVKALSKDASKTQSFIITR